MIEKIIGATIVPDIQALGWADQIGWVVKPWTKRIETGEGQFSDIVFPVAEFVTTEDCDVTDYGLNILTTDKGYTSLILISLEGDMVSETAPNIPQRMALNIEQDIKISVWLNNHQGSTHLAKAELMKALYRTIYRDVTIQWPYIGAADTDYDIFINKLKVTLVREIVTNPFNEYTFSKDQAQFHNNYSAFGFVFKLSGLIFPNCLPAYPVLDPDACETPTNADMPITSSGTYTPTLSNLSNISSATAAECQYMRVGNTVTVSGKFTATCSGVTTGNALVMTLPIASNISEDQDVAGVFSGANGGAGYVYGSTATDSARVVFINGPLSSSAYYFTFTYQII
mgnify:CR=1 FL=1